MKYGFIEDHRSALRVGKMCHALKVSRSGYYGWLNRKESDREKSNRKLLEEIARIHRESRQTYGSPRITAQLRAEGCGCGRKRVARLMRENGIMAKTRRKFKVTTDSEHKYPVLPNLVNQEFVAQRLGQLWCADITYIWTGEGWLYLSVILDVYSRRIVGWKVARSLDKELVVDTLRKAANNCPMETELIFHSDRGSQYASFKFQKLLRSYGMRASMSGKGNCYDNAMVESFFHTLKTELVYWESYQTREEARLSIFDYIEVFYNRRRIHSALGYKTPLEFENQITYLNCVSEIAG